MPPPSPDWVLEISLDLDMVSAVCPNCHILLVEANTNLDSDLYTAEDTAARLGGNAISNSWGGSEYSRAAAGPAAGRTRPGAGRAAVAGAYESKPSWQTDSGCARRTVSDVSAVADPNTGVAVLYAGLWFTVGGTSASSPIVASVYALAGNAGSVNAGSYPYSHTSGLFDVTIGSNGTCSPTTSAMGGRATTARPVSERRTASRASSASERGPARTGPRFAKLPA